MNVVRNFLFAIAGTALISAGLFGVFLFAPGATSVGTNTPPPTPVLLGNPGTQEALGSFNNVIAPTGTTTPTTPSEINGGVQSFNSSLPADYAPFYALESAGFLQAFIDTQRVQANVPALAYDPQLGQVAAALIMDTINSGLFFPAPGGLNSKGQTPLQQLMAQFPTTTATYVSSYIVVLDTVNTNQASSPQAGIAPVEADLLADPNQIMINAGWTHYGLAVITSPAVAGQKNAVRYYAVFFAKE